MRIENDEKLDYADVLIRPKRSTLKTRKEVSLERDFRFYWGGYWSGIPLVASNMDTTGTVEMGRVMCTFDMLTCLSKHIASWPEQEDYTNTTTAISFGISEHDQEALLSSNGVVEQFAEHHPFFCLDVANGYMQGFVDYVKEVRQKWPDKIIIAGNVVTAEMTEALILAGADIVKVGIGPGSVCTTRKVAGVGYPQLSAVIECADAAHGLGGHIMADGGCTCSGDVAKAFGAGADFVMLGGMLAGHDECEGDVVEVDGVAHKRFYGMSSTTAMERHNGGVATHRASEGKTVMVPYKGPVADTLKEILGGLRSACTYVGADCLKALPKCTTFVRVRRQLNNIFK
jgi:GMP reductase